ncbi:MAG TPA: PilN domain-containing protein [Terriglobales bacterium]|nr:PilN domain-containing protein [Terriglobales bacterium]
MRTRINLATQPYENVRRFWLAWGLTLVLAVVVAGGLLFAAVRGWRESHRVQRLVAQEREHLARLDEQEKKDLELLNSPQNRDVRLKSEFLNSLMLRKGFSWTQIFSDMERVMPDHLHVLSITPAVNDEGQIELRINVAGESRLKAIELVQNMERSRAFRDAAVIAEANTDAREARTAGDAVQFQITAIYEPAAAGRSGD